MRSFLQFNFLNAAILCLALAAPSLAGAATLEGQSFEDDIRLAHNDLHLNGLGLRARFIIKGYVAGLYLKEKAATQQAVVAMPGPKRLQMRMLLSVGPEEFNKALVAGIRKNASEAELARLNERIAQFEHSITSIGKILKGDVVNLDFVPGLGMTLSVNGVVKGPVIAGADFYEAVLGIFVGEHPVDEKLKKGLLGL